MRKCWPNRLKQNLVLFLQAIFYKTFPLSQREKYIYPLIATTRKTIASVVVALDPIRLRIETVFCGLQYKNAKRVKRSLGKISEEWRLRIEDVCSCPDNQHIPRHPQAGKISGSTVTMHNGLKVRALGYYGDGILNMLVLNRGVHEPQEERAFAEVLRHIPNGGSMLELGAYWGFYSMWFASIVQNAKCYLVEPDPRNIESGKQNFRINSLNADFTCSAIGSLETTGLLSAPLISVDQFCAKRGIPKLNILHADIQGAELPMLEGASQMLKRRNIDFVFISTHGNPRHYPCLEFLESMDYKILCAANSDESFSLDGLIVAKNPEISLPRRIEISLRKTC